LLDRELGKGIAHNVVTHIKELQHEQYRWYQSRRQSPCGATRNAKDHREARIIQRLQPKKRYSTDRDRYCEDDIVMIDGATSQGKNWLSSWWSAQSNKYPQPAAAARNLRYSNKHS
jgi:hypothetical protein